MLGDSRKVGQSRCNREQRLIWLGVNREYWEHLKLPIPGYHGEWHQWRVDYQKPIVEAMMDVGLLSKKTYWMDINIPDMIRAVLKIEDQEYQYPFILSSRGWV